MNTNNEFHIMQLSDSFFPSGMFSMSGGLESLVHHNKVTDWQQVLEFIKEQMEFQLIPCDCSVLAITMNAVQNNDLNQVVNVDNKYYSIKLTKEVRNSSVRSGKQIFNCLIHMLEKDDNKNHFVKQFKNKIETKASPCTYPVALGITGECLGISTSSAIRILLYSFSSSVVSAAIRLGIIQHLDAQKVLMLLEEPVNNYISNKIKEKTSTDIWQLTPLTEIHQMDHEHNESRMFIT